MLLGEAYGKTGQVEEGLRVFAEALALTYDGGEHRWEAELERLTGELLLRCANPDEPQAETLFSAGLRPGTAPAG